MQNCKRTLSSLPRNDLIRPLPDIAGDKICLFGTVFRHLYGLWESHRLLGFSRGAYTARRSASYHGLYTRSDVLIVLLACCTKLVCYLLATSSKSHLRIKCTNAPMTSVGSNPTSSRKPFALMYPSSLLASGSSQLIVTFGYPIDYTCIRDTVDSVGIIPNDCRSLPRILSFVRSDMQSHLMSDVRNLRPTYGIGPPQQKSHLG
jgi:hypothetical protein